MNNKTTRKDHGKPVLDFVKSINEGRGIGNGLTKMFDFLSIEIEGEGIFNNQIVHFEHKAGANAYTLTIMNDDIVKISKRAVFWSSFVEFEFSEDSNILSFNAEGLSIHIMPPTTEL